MSFDLKKSKLWMMAEKSEERKAKEVLKWENILAKFAREFRELEREWDKRAGNPAHQQMLFKEVVNLQDKIQWAENELDKAKRI